MMKLVMTAMAAFMLAMGVNGREMRDPDGNWLISAVMMNGMLTNVSDKPWQMEFRKTEGQVSLKICNRIAGKYSLKNGKIKVGPLLSTKMMCPEMDYEMAISKALQEADSIEFEQQTLKLKKGKAVLMVLTMPV